MKSRRLTRKIHRIVGLLTVLGLTLVSITGLLINMPDWVPNQNAIISVVSGSENKQFILRERSLSEMTKSGETPIKPWHPIHPGDHLVGITDGIAILHRDQIITVYQDELWDRLRLPENIGWITQVSSADDTWTITTTTGIWNSEDFGQSWTLIIGPYPESVRDTIKKLHSGWYFGKIGSVWINLTALATIILTVTGLVIYRRKSKTN